MPHLFVMVMALYSLIVLMCR